MSRMLVIYGTTDGHTAKVARMIGDALRSRGVDADVIEATGTDIGPEDYGAIIVAASVRAGGYQRSVRKWVRKHVEGLRGKPTAFVSVCLAVLQKDDSKAQQRLTRIIDSFLAESSWQPTVIKKVPGALLYTRYNIVVRWMMKRIVAKAGGDTDTSRDYEYTDWDDVRAFAIGFSQNVPFSRGVRIEAVAV